jgi:hypothetical protein
MVTADATVVLSTLADGTLLPPLVVLKVPILPIFSLLLLRRMMSIEQKQSGHTFLLQTLLRPSIFSLLLSLILAIIFP